MNSLSAKTIERLSHYRRVLKELTESGKTHIYSHELAALVGSTAAQVRRDVMGLGVIGTPVKGYEIEDLLHKIGKIFDTYEPQKVALAGVGNLGRAILAYFWGRSPQFMITAAFDVDPMKVNRVLHGCRCYHVSELPQVVQEENIKIGMVAVPADQAQQVANSFCASGILGLLNFAPVRLRLPKNVHVENLDLLTSLERIGYFVRNVVKVPHC